MYDTRSNLIIGFHGTDKGTAEKLINQPNNIKLSEEPWDWLGHGFYFWENNEARALNWAKDRQRRKNLPESDAAVVGAVIQLGYCCDLTDSRFTQLVRGFFLLMKDAYEKADKPMPANKDSQDDEHKDRLMRVLDCAVIQYMHSTIEEAYFQECASKGYSSLKLFDSVRGVFTEGGLIYDGAGIYAKSHIQLCIRNPNCIKGFFNPRTEVEFIKSLKDKALA